MSQPTYTDLPATEITTADIPPLKPGYATTEFWLTFLTSALGIAVALGWVGPDFAKHHEDLVNALALMASILAPSIYAVARNIAKGKHQAARAHVVATQMAYQSPLPVIAAPKAT